MDECPTTSVNISSKCLQLANRNLSNILDDTNVSSVIIATTWYADTYIDSNGNTIDPKGLKLAVEHLINHIMSSGKQPMLFFPIAILKKDYASELARKLWFNHINKQEGYGFFEVTRSKFDNEFSELNEYFIDLLGSSHIKIYEELCDQSSCFYGTDELFYFADGNHLSQHAVMKFDKTKSHLRSLLMSYD